MSLNITLILGGARSGKSTYAEELARKCTGRVLYIATATAGDEEMAARIAAHQAARPAHWQTLEAPLHIGQAVKNLPETPDLILLDCLTLLANNVLFSLPEDPAQNEYHRALNEEIEAILAAVQASNTRWVIVSNEVGLGLVPPYPLGRIYRDELGRANQRLAAAADEVIFMVAGLPMWVKKPSQAT